MLTLTLVLISWANFDFLSKVKSTVLYLMLTIKSLFFKLLHKVLDMFEG